MLLSLFYGSISFNSQTLKRSPETICRAENTKRISDMNDFANAVRCVSVQFVWLVSFMKRCQGNKANQIIFSFLLFEHVASNETFYFVSKLHFFATFSSLIVFRDFGFRQEITLYLLTLKLIFK